MIQVRYEHRDPGQNERLGDLTSWRIVGTIPAVGDRLSVAPDWSPEVRQRVFWYIPIVSVNIETPSSITHVTKCLVLVA